MAYAPLGPVKYLTIHCAATPEFRDVKASSIVAWNKARFGQVSYHDVIELDGTIVNTLAIDKRGAHVAGKNTGNIGICYVGGCDKNMRPKDTRNTLQKAALRARVAHYKKLFPDIIVRGHRDWPNVNKACPSFDVASEL